MMNRDLLRLAVYALVVSLSSALAALVFVGSRWGERLIEGDARRRVLVHPLRVGEPIRVPYYASTDVVRLALHGLGRREVAGEAFAELVVTYHSPGKTRVDKVRVALPITSARTKLEERIGLAWDAEAVNLDVRRDDGLAGPSAGEVSVSLERLEGAEGAAVRAYRREPSDLVASGTREVSFVELGETGGAPELFTQAARRAQWHRASILTGGGGHPPSQAIVLGPVTPPPPLPPRPHVVPAQKKTVYRATPEAPVRVDATFAALTVRVGLRMPVEANASERHRFMVTLEGGPIPKAVTQRFDELSPMAMTAHYETGSPVTEETALYLLLPKGARATLTPESTLDVDLREIDLDAVDHLQPESDAPAWLGRSRPPSNLEAARLERLVLILDPDLRVFPTRVLDRAEARPSVLGSSILLFPSRGSQAHVPVHVPRATTAVALVDGGSPRRKRWGAVKRLTPGVRQLETTDVTDLLVGDDLAEGDHRLEMREGSDLLPITPVRRLPPRWIEGAALGPHEEEVPALANAL